MDKNEKYHLAPITILIVTNWSFIEVNGDPIIILAMVKITFQKW